MVAGKIFQSLRGNDTSLSGVQFYALSVFLLVSVASVLAINAMSLGDVTRVMVGCAVPIGTYACLLKGLGRHEVAILVFIGGLVALPFVPYVRYAYYMLSALGWLSLMRRKWEIDKDQLLSLPILFAAILGSSMYSDFQYNSLLNTGEIHLDTLFHSAIAAMYSHYGVASIGLDGLVPIAYHTLSHKIMAGLAMLSGMETLAVYSYLFFAMGPLLLAIGLAVLTCQLRSSLRFAHALLGVALLMLVIRAVPVFGWVAMWDSYFTSESYLVALIIFTASLSTYIRWMGKDSENLSQLVIALLLLVLAGLAKGSVGLIGICVFVFLGITRYRIASYWLLITIAAVGMYFGLNEAAASMRQYAPVDPFDFITSYSRLPFNAPPSVKAICFLVVHFSPVWLCFGLGLRKSGPIYLKGLEFQVLFAMLLPALFFSLTFKFAGGSAYYFSNIPVVISFAFLIPSFSSWLKAIKYKHVIFIAVFSGLAIHAAILNRSFMREFRENEVDPTSLRLIDQQLRMVRENVSADVLVRIENPELLVNQIGCKAYWFFPAVMERPLAEGLPNNDLCPDFHGSYGLSEYNEIRSNTRMYKVIQLRIGRD